MRVVFFVHCFFPSHFYGTETYTLELAKRGYTLTAVDFIGRVVYNEIIDANEGENVHDVNMINVAKGVYILMLENETTKEQTRIVLQ